MISTIFLPKTIKVGYQTRSDTYTGQLAYIRSEGREYFYWVKRKLMKK